MSFGNEKREDPRTHFRTEPGYRGPHDHSVGLTDDEVREALGSEDKWDAFNKWMRGQTVGLCPHGCRLVYRYDLGNFMRGGKVWD